MKKVDRNEEVSGVEVQKIFKDIFLLFYYELKVSFVTDFKKWQREKDNHIYIALRLAQVIVNDLLDIKFTLDQMLTVRISSSKEMEDIILESELCRFEPNIKNVKNCTCTIQAKDKDMLEIRCIY